MSPTNRHKTRIILLFLLALLFIVLSEGVYVFMHRDVMSTYLLKTAQLFARKNNTDLSIYFLTQGKVKLPESFKPVVKEYLVNIPEGRDLPLATYDLALSAYEMNIPEVTPKLLEASISRDPDFSFWRVELSNYYLSVGAEVSATQVIDTCISLPLPSAHCLDYKNANLVTKSPQKVGFLKDSIQNFYYSKNVSTVSQ